MSANNCRVLKNGDESSTSDDESENESKLRKTLSKASRNAASRFATSKAAGVFIDSNYKNLLTTFKDSIAHHTSDKKLAKKLIHICLKIVVKVAVLEMQDELSEKELKGIDLFKIKVHSIAQTMLTFYEVQYNFDKGNLRNILADCQAAAHQSIGTKLSSKSHESLDEVFRYLIYSNYVDRLFDRKDTMYPYLVDIVPSLRLLINKHLL